MKTRTYIIATALATFVFMLSFEAVKELLFGAFFHHMLTRWQSHWITIFFTTLAVSAISAFFIRNFAEMKRKEEVLRLKKEKLLTLRQSMHKMNFHVHDLAARLALLEQEYQASGKVGADTLARMEDSVSSATHEIEALFSVDDPFDARNFKIGFLPELPAPAPESGES